MRLRMFPLYIPPDFRRFRPRSAQAAEKFAERFQWLVLCCSRAGRTPYYAGAMKAVAPAQKLRVPADAAVTATVGIGPRSEGGFGITADLKVSLPGLERIDAERLINAAHQVCPYSNATRGNVDVGLSLA